MHSHRLTLQNYSPPCFGHSAKSVSTTTHFVVLSLTHANTQALPEFESVLHIHDETSNQAFFVNTALLQKSCEDACTLGNREVEEDRRITSDGWIDCVSLETLPVLVGVDTPSPLRINETEVLFLRWPNNLNSDKYGITSLGISP